MKKIEMWRDQGFRKGFRVHGGTHEEGYVGELHWEEAAGSCDWTLAQWACRHNIAEGTREGDAYATPSQTVERYQEDEDVVLTLELRASREYECARQEGQDWPHLLLGQEMGERCPSLEQLERLGIPVLVERSSYESHPLGRMEWIKLYGVLLGRRQEAEDYFAAQLERLEPILEQENTGRTVAFFSVTSNGSVTVRKSGDYIAKAIALAGGVYAFQELAEEENALSTINIQMETFYDQARDADVLIYNSAIEADLDTIEQLVDKSAPLADFKAVKSGDVWCTGKSMFQESQSVGDMMLDIHAIVSEENPAEGSLTYLHRLK